MVVLRGGCCSEQSVPTDLPPGGRGYIEIELFNVGAVASSGQVTVTDVLPAGVTFVEQTSPEWSCAGSSTVTCTTVDSIDGGGRRMPEAIGEEAIELEVTVEAGREETVESVLSASGGGALETATLRRSLTLSNESAAFGVTDMQVWASNPDGSVDTRAGSHPYELGYGVRSQRSARQVGCGTRRTETAARGQRNA